MPVLSGAIFRRRLGCQNFFGRLCHGKMAPSLSRNKFLVAFDDWAAEEIYAIHDCLKFLLVICVFHVVVVSYDSFIDSDVFDRTWSFSSEKAFIAICLKELEDR